MCAALVACALVAAGCSGGGSMNVPEPDVASTITVTSEAFAEGRPIPRDHTCRGVGRVPPLSWRGVPAEAASVALVVSDPDAPRGTFIHWLLYDLPPRDGSLGPGGPPPGAKEGKNSAGETGWYAPCPPSGTHRYVFAGYALREPATGGSTQQILDAIGRTAVARGTLTGVVSAS
jgi:Raf kinase inhibitor-like YbhB/YbcL family protein